MTLDQFTDLLDRFGSRPDQWPAPERTAAEQLLAASAETAARLRQAQRVDSLMHRFDPGGVIDQAAVIGLSNSVLARLPPMGARRHPWWRAALDHLGTALGAGREWGPRLAVSVAAAAILGLVTGGLLPTGDTQELSAVELLAMSNTYLPLDLR